jgi:hypothetical protein
MEKRILLPLFVSAFLAFGINASGQGGTLPLNNSVSGNLTSSAPDVWDVTTNADGLFRLTFTTVNPADLFVSLYDNDGTTVLAGPVESFNNSTVTLSVDGLSPGTYHVKITPFFSDFGSYILSDSLFTSNIANDPEPNNDRASALSLPLNGNSTGHVGYYYNNHRDSVDWYKVTTTADGLLRVYLQTDSGSIYSTTGTNPLDVNVGLYDNDGTTQLGFVEVFNGYGPAAGLITADGLAPGTYYIKIQPFATTEFANYTLSDSLFTASLANDAEPNGTAATAIVLPLNGSKTGRVGYYYNHQRDTVDWYKVTTTDDGLLRVYLATDTGSIYSTSSSNPLDVNVTLYDNDATTQLGAVEVFNGDGPATNLITMDGLAPGTYYIKVQPFSTTEFANYTLSDSLFIPAIAADAEPNGSPATAIDFPVNSNLKGHSGYYYNHLRDTADFYKVTTTSDGPLYVYLNTARGSVYSNNTLDMLLTFYDVDGVTQLGGVEVYNGGNPGVDSLIFPTLPTGTYFIKITNFSATEFADYSLSNSVTPGDLPVTFLHFDGKLIDNTVQLTWSTASEVNNKGFEVEKSTDGQTFSSIGFVAGDGNSSLVNTYQFTDFKVLSGSNYYRLKQVDMDGNFNYSTTIRLDLKNFAWAIFGNPITSNSWIQLQITKTSNIAFQIFSIDGRRIQTIDLGKISAGSYRVPLNLGNAPAGIYIINLVQDNQTLSKIISK